MEQLYGPPQWREPAQAAVLPVMLDEFVAPDALVRVIDGWIAALPMAYLGFAKSILQRMGAPPYDTADLLRLYLQGYLNATRPFRSLRRECHHNAECMWLLGAGRRLKQSHRRPAPGLVQKAQCNAQQIERYLALLEESARQETSTPGQGIRVCKALAQLQANSEATAG
ncbi:transposase [Delftia sp. JD2]|uniref:transposase n=1 Tax=Delftia sp. JD2 TaxID=469553 RepID=UPI0020C7F5BB|nr:transposase [Delftia sp. JD2]